MNDGVRHASQVDCEQREIERRMSSRGGRRKNDTRPDNAFDKYVAYFSYHVLIFTAVCIFMPVQTANAWSYALHTVTANAKMTTAPVAPVQWNIRGSLS